MRRMRKLRTRSKMMILTLLEEEACLFCGDDEMGKELKLCRERNLTPRY